MKSALLAHRAVERLEARLFLSIVYVDGEAGGSFVNDGSSWEHAFLDLQTALGTAEPGSEVRVADGKYVADESGADPTYHLRNGITLKGGYAGWGAADTDARDPRGTPSILHNNDAGHAASVVDANSVGPTAIIDGFTVEAFGFTSIGMVVSGGSPQIFNCVFRGGMGLYVTDADLIVSNCLFDQNDGIDGGGMTLFNSTLTLNDSTFNECFGRRGGAFWSDSSTLSVSRCIFTGNNANHQGQAVYSIESLATFTDCVFQNNRRNYESGGAIYSGGAATLTLRGCSFIDNEADMGGALYAWSPLDIFNCTFTRNRGVYWGSAIYARGSLTVANSFFEGNRSYYTGAIDALSVTVELTNCVFAGNEASTGGKGAALSLDSSTATLTNCTLAGNRSGNTGGAIWLAGSTLNLRNTIISGNDAAHDGDQIYIFPTKTSSITFDHSHVQDPYGGEERLFVRMPDPGADADFGTEDDDYGNLRVRMDAGVGYTDIVDGGDNSLLPPGITTDIAGKQRFVDYRQNGAIVDIGAYEYQWPLRAIAGAYLFNAAKPTISISFNGDLRDWDGLSAEDLILVDPITNTPIDGLPSPTVSYDSTTRTANWIFPLLPDGNYRAKVLAGTIEDYYGGELAADFTFDFFVLAGDANRDRKVDSLDLGILAMHWQGSEKTFGQGDFDYDGNVDLRDLYILAGNWNKTLAPPAAASSLRITPARRAVVRTVGLVG